MASSSASRTLTSVLALHARAHLTSVLALHARAHLISSWAKKMCTSSVPVRYIPKGTQIKIAQHSPPRASSKKKEADSIRNKLSKSGRGSRDVPILDDKELWQEMYVPGTEQTSDTIEQVGEFLEVDDRTGPTPELANTDSRNKSGWFLEDASTSQENNHTDSSEAAITKIREDVENMAIKLLGARAFTTVELQKKLRGKKFPLNVVEAVIIDLKCRGLLNDGLYAESFSQSRWLTSTWGPRRIKQALIQKGVSASEAHEATKHVFEDDDDDPSDGSHHMQHGMSKISMDHLLLQASKQWLRGRDTSPEKRKLRVLRWLQYRGFNWGVTNSILKKLEPQYPP